MAQKTVNVMSVNTWLPSWTAALLRLTDKFAGGSSSDRKVRVQILTGLIQAPSSLPSG
jgi:hypothetical protein